MDAVRGERMALIRAGRSRQAGARQMAPAPAWTGMYWTDDGTRYWATGSRVAGGGAFAEGIGCRSGDLRAGCSISR